MFSTTLAGLTVAEVQFVVKDVVIPTAVMVIVGGAGVVVVTLLLLWWRARVRRRSR